MSISAMKQALEALEDIWGYLPTKKAWPQDQVDEAIQTLRQAIAEAEKQEPVAWFIQYEYRHKFLWREPTAYEKNSALEIKPLYLAPVHASDISQERVDETAKREHEFEEMVKRGTKAWADTPDDWVDELRGGVEKREWVGLTHEERDEIDQSCRSQMQAIFSTEEKLKEKNT